MHEFLLEESKVRNMYYWSRASSRRREGERRGGERERERESAIRDVDVPALLASSRYSAGLNENIAEYRAIHKTVNSGLFIGVDFAGHVFDRGSGVERNRSKLANARFLLQNKSLRPPRAKSVYMSDKSKLV